MIGYDDVVSGDSPENKSAISENRCPECRGTGAVEARFPVSEGFPECPVCGGDGLDGAKKPTEKLGDTVPGQEVLPADLIDRATEVISSGIAGFWDDDAVGPDPAFTPDEVAAAAAQVVEADIAPELVEHGRQQEREKWEARIEKLAAEHDEQVAWYQQRAAEQPRTSSRNRKYAEILLSNAESEIRQAERIRSLLTEEGENGE